MHLYQKLAECTEWKHVAVDTVLALAKRSPKWKEHVHSFVQWATNSV